MLWCGHEQPGPGTDWSPEAAEGIKKAEGEEALAAHLERYQGHILGGRKDLEPQATDFCFVIAASRVILSAKEMLGCNLFFLR